MTRRSKADPAALIGSVDAPARPVEDRGALAIQRLADDSILHVEAHAQKGGYGAKLRNVTIDPLDWYLHRGQIDGRMYTAGDRVRSLHYAAHGSGYAQTNLATFHGTTSRAGNWRYTSRQAHAMRELGETLAVLSDVERVMVERVCCWGEFANRVAQDRFRVRARLGISVLRKALLRLADELSGP